MLFDRNPLFPTLVDKFAVRTYAGARGVATAPLLTVIEAPGELSFSDMPPDCFIKATHGSGWNICRAAGRLFLFGDGSRLIASGAATEGTLPGEITQPECVAWCGYWLGRSWHRREWAYLSAPPRLVIEAPLAPRVGVELLDHRFYTYGGAVKAISIGSPAYRRLGQNVFLDPDWNVIPMEPGVLSLPSPLPPRPETLSAMRAAAEALGRGLDFARIDLYDSAVGICLGEITLYPESGYRWTPTRSRTFNRWLGGHWERPGAVHR
jgi:hypothetical protein